MGVLTWENALKESSWKSLRPASLELVGKEICYYFYCFNVTKGIADSGNIGITFP